jgi:hypothetical protein
MRPRGPKEGAFLLLVNIAEEPDGPFHTEIRRQALQPVAIITVARDVHTNITTGAARSGKGVKQRIQPLVALEAPDVELPREPPDARGRSGCSR